MFGLVRPAPAGHVWSMRVLSIASAAAVALGWAGPPAPAQVHAKEQLAPSEIVQAAPASDWIDIPESDLQVMEIAGGGRVTIQLAPTFAPIHVANIRELAGNGWWDGTSINRVQDNYVVQWGDPTEKKALPARIVAHPPEEYVRDLRSLKPKWNPWPDAYAKQTGFIDGWPVGGNGRKLWLVHCYGMVGVGRNLAPDTGSGAELYAVIGHAPRHLDRNIALVGRVLEGIDFLASRPRGTEALGFYKHPQQRIGIDSVRAMSEAGAESRSGWQYLSGGSFDRYRDARANRRDPFFNIPAGGADICNIPVPVRRKP
jgi:peptidylprolyl isomerase